MPENLQRKSLNLKLNPAEDIFSFNDQSFDVITLWHVLEHIHRLNENMDTFFRLLKPGGKLIIAVPNYTSYDAQTLYRNIGLHGMCPVIFGILLLKT
jgi:predicted SAM-dependent methyltransferase